MNERNNKNLKLWLQNFIAGDIRRVKPWNDRVYLTNATETSSDTHYQSLLFFLFQSLSSSQAAKLSTSLPVHFHVAPLIDITVPLQ